MDKFLRKIQELEREAQNLIDQEGSESIPSSGQPSQPKWAVQRRFSHRLSSSPGKSDLLDDGYQSSPETKEQQANQSSTSQEPNVEAGDGDWLREFRNEAGSWNGKKLVVLSLFDGIGGVWAALSRLKIPFDGYSSEVSAPAIEVVKTRFPEVQHLGDVRRLERSAIRDEVDLLVGGFPCQDLSCMGKREGLHGQRSRLFFDLLEAMKIFQPKWFLVENVASMSWIDRLEISKYIGVQPLELDSIELTPTRRKRLYWTNIPHPPRLPRVRDHPSTLVQSCLQNAIALEEKTGVIIGYTSEKSNSCNLERAFKERTEGLRRLVQVKVERLLGFSPNHTDVRVEERYNNYRAQILCQLELVMENGTNSLRYISHYELELLMGYPPHHTGVLVHPGANSQTSLFPLTKGKNGKTSKGGNRKGGRGDGENVSKVPLKAAVRWLMLGNTFSVQVIAYLLSPLLTRSVRDLGQPVQIPWSTSEKHCSAMEVDDIWALYNQDERPNWYAIIVRRTGDRFSKKKTYASTGAGVTKKLPLYVEMQYLEITPAYAVNETDVWNPLRGTGLYEARQTIDIQDSWTPFSHRVTSFVRTANKVFIFPGRGEVWTVYCQKIWSPFFVYVKESTIISFKTVESVRPNAEGFFSRCYLVIKTGERETYRISEKVLEFEDLSMFCFQVPYTFKQQANLLKIELGTGGRKNKRIQAKVRRGMLERKRRREMKPDGGSSSEEDFLPRETFGELAQDVADVTETPLNRAEESNIELEVHLNCRYSCESIQSLSSDSEGSDPECETYARDNPILIDLDDYE